MYMKNLYALLFAVFFFGCQNNEVSQNPKVLEGIYKTNAFLDPLCIAIENENQLPRLDITQNTDGSYHLLKTTFLPQTATTSLEGISAVANSGGFILYYKNQKIGTYEDGKWYDGKKEVNSRVLRVSYTDSQQSTFFYYSGVKK